MVTGDFIGGDPSPRFRELTPNDRLCLLLSQAHVPPRERIAELLAQGASPNARDARSGYKTSALSIAAKQGHVAAMKQLLAAGADITLKASDNSNCLHEAAGSLHPQCVSLILSHPAAKGLLNAQDEYLYTPLVHALNNHCTTPDEEKRLKQVCNRLLDAGADVNIQTNDQATALMFSTHHDQPALVKRLIAKSDHIDQLDDNGWSALITAAQNLNPQNVRLLLEASANPNLCDKRGCTAMYYATSKSRHDQPAADIVQIIECLSQWGADVNILNHADTTPLSKAFSNPAHVEVKRALLDLGAHITPDCDSFPLAEARIEQAQQRWNETIGATPPDVSTLTTTDLIWFSNIGRLGDALQTALWQTHREQLHAMLIGLPPYLADSITTLPICAPSPSVGQWTHEGIATSPAPATTRISGKGM